MCVSFHLENQIGRVVSNDVVVHLFKQKLSPIVSIDIEYIYIDESVSVLDKDERLVFL